MYNGHVLSSTQDQNQPNLSSAKVDQVACMDEVAIGCKVLAFSRFRRTADEAAALTKPEV
jgi:hypothetical protein